MYEKKSGSSRALHGHIIDLVQEGKNPVTLFVPICFPVLMVFVVLNRNVPLITWYSALVWLVPGVCPDVLLEVGQLRELSLADLAAVGLDAQVDPGVLGQVGAVGEGLAAAGALVGLGFSHVDLGVQLQVSFAREYLKRQLSIKKNCWRKHRKDI